MTDTAPPRLEDSDEARHPDWPHVLEWVEKQAQDSLRSRFETAGIVAKEAQTTLTVLLAGIGGTAAYAAKLLEAGPPTVLMIASAVVCCYLVVLAVLLVTQCMMLRSYPALFQQPKNLLQPLYTLTELREAELANLNERIEEAAKLNRERARRLNMIRVATALSPVLVVGVSLLVEQPSATPQVHRTIACTAMEAASGSTVELRCSWPE